jgi:peptidoglycan/LPS O-acetylase OafA/YrhL
LRAIAVLLVVVFHAAKYDERISGSVHSSAATLLKYGCHGVDLFFVLSGFCLAYPTLARIHTQGIVRFDVVRFAAHRIIRIVPPYYAAIALFATAAMVSNYAHLRLPAAMPPSGISAVDIARQFLFLDLGAQFLNGSFWSLPIEFRWYFVFPVVLLVWIRAPRAFFVVIGSVLMLAATRAFSIDVAVLPAFMLGIVAAAVRVRGRSAMRLAPVGFVVALTAAVLLSRNGAWLWSTSVFWELSAFTLVVTCGNSRILVAALSSSAMTAIGAASYSIYLVHEPVVAFVGEHADRLGNYAFIVAVAAGLAAGVAFWWCAERPFVNTPLRESLRERLERYFSARFSKAQIPQTITIGTPIVAGPHASGAQMNSAPADAGAGVFDHARVKDSVASIWFVRRSSGLRRGRDDGETAAGVRVRGRAAQDEEHVHREVEPCVRSRSPGRARGETVRVQRRQSGSVARLRPGIPAARARQREVVDRHDVVGMARSGDVSGREHDDASGAASG